MIAGVVAGADVAAAAQSRDTDTGACPQQNQIATDIGGSRYLDERQRVGFLLRR